LAAVTLGGDPQTAYHLILMAAVYAWLVRRGERKAAPAGALPAEGKKQDDESATPPRWRGNRLVLLTLAVAMAFALAAVQVLPTWELLGLSDRAESDAPRSLCELAVGVPPLGGAPRNAAPPEGGTPTSTPPEGGTPTSTPPEGGTPTPWYAGLLSRPSSPAGETSLDRASDFSVGPWRWPEFLWPNFSGRQYPVHRRWIEALPAEGRAFCPSLYFGCLPLLLALRCRAWRKTTPQGRLMFWLCVTGLIGALGEYGLSWLSKQATALFSPGATKDWPVGDALGGLYWLMTVVLPGYVGFRYPGKLLVLFSLGASMLAAQGWRELAEEGDKAQSPPRWRSAMILVVASAVGLVVALAVKRFWAQWVGGAEPDPLFGPLDVNGAWSDVVWSFGQTLVVTTIGWCVATFWLRRAKLTGVVVLMVTAADLAVANGWMLSTAPAPLWHDRSRVADAINEDAQHDGVDSFRVGRGSDWFPADWAKSVGTVRQAEGVAFDRDTLSPKYHLLHGVALVNSPETLANRDLQTLHLFSPLREETPATRTADGRPLPVHPELLSALGVRYLVLPPGAAPPATWQPLESPALTGVETCVWKNPSAQPRAWAVYDVEVLPEPADRRPAAIKERTRDVLFPGGLSRDFVRTAVVEVNDVAYWTKQFRRRAPAAAIGGECRVVAAGPQEVHVDVHLPSPGLVVLADLYYPGWTAEVSTRSAVGEWSPPTPLSILRTNRVLRGVYLPAGEHRVTYRYRPATYTWGLCLSGAGAIAWLGTLFWRSPTGQAQKPAA
ncbi:MAG: hypothetical protein HYS13_16725, partial [Planctomycetia bacterium]|nr:hypothetical protein [Planctomycetia bacterium]